MHRPTEAFLRSIDIHELLPQQEPFVIVGEVTHFDDEGIVTRTRIGDGLFVADGRLGSAGVMENIAQTCSARIGYINRYILGRELAAGVIAGIRRLEVKRQPRVGEVITTSVRVVTEAMGMMSAEAAVTGEKGEIAAGEVVMAMR